MTVDNLKAIYLDISYKSSTFVSTSISQFKETVFDILCKHSTNAQIKYIETVSLCFTH